jgi:adenine-specific DNA-methyltransferase
MAESYAQNGWDWRSPADWADALGLVCVPMFGRAHLHPPQGRHAVLLDGQHGSFLISTGDIRKAVADQSPLSWAWSSNLIHSLILDEDRKEALLWRWDDPDMWRRLPPPSSPSAAQAVLDRIDHAAPPRLPAVVDRVLAIFRQLRHAVHAASGTAMHVVCAFNALIAGAGAIVNKRAASEPEWRRCRTIADILALIPAPEFASITHLDFPAQVGSCDISPVIEAVIDPDPATKCRLDPDLLIRHASGDVYQEAHFELERKPHRQGEFFAGYSSGAGDDGELKREVRFTPPTLARALVEQAFQVLRTFGVTGQPITVLDPACGSGLFLREALQEAEADPDGAFREITLVGFDSSDIAHSIARFCLGKAVADVDPRLSPTLDLHITNALNRHWGTPDIIVMNPPFAAWNDLDDADKESVRTVLTEFGDDGEERSLLKHPDKAMAFVAKAAASMKPGAVLACIIPSPLLENKAGVVWRRRLVSEAGLVVHTIGRFRGFSYFKGAVVEPAFLVLAKPLTPRPPRWFVQIVLATSGCEDKALRALRTDPVGERGDLAAKWEVYRSFDWKPDPASWLPRPRRVLSLIKRLTDIGLPRVGQLFKIKQGARLGAKGVFMRPAREVAAFGADVAQYFRPVADNKSIQDGQILRTWQVFYPYDDDGKSAFLDEDALRVGAGRYYELYLKPAKEQLEREYKERWWELSRPRSWQHRTERKIVSAYFANRGKFAYDSKAEFTVVQGFGWFWRKGEFSSTNLPWAYLAVFNSPLFERMLELFCPTVRGGQYDVSERFVGHVFLPDLSNQELTPADALSDLVDLGQEMAQGDMPSPRILNNAAARVFGIRSEDIV